MKRVLMVANVASMIRQFNMHNIRILKELGFEVDVACNFEKGNTITESAVLDLKHQLETLRVQYYQIEFSRSSFSFGKHIKSYRQLITLMSSRSYSFVHTHAPISSAIVRLVSRRKSVPVVYTAHGFHFYSGGPTSSWLIYYPIELMLSKSTNTLITINQEDYELASRRFSPKFLNRVYGVGIEASRYSIADFNKMQYRRQLGLPDDAFVVLSTGELSKRKNHSVVIEALAKIRNPRVCYLIAGKGELEKSLKEQISRLNLKNQVLLLGYRTDIPELCNLADVFAFPSIREGLGLACLEAMAAGIPAIAADTSGPREYVIPNETGFLCPSHNASAFAEAISDLLSNPTLRERLGDNARIMAQKYDIGRTNEVMKSIYGRFVSGTGGSQVQ